MNKKIIVYSVILIAILITIMGCDKKDRQSKVETTINENKHTLNEMNINLAVDEFEIDDIKKFILIADSLSNKLIEDDNIASQKVIGKIDNADVFEYVGKYDSFEKVMQLIGAYYTVETAQMELFRRNLVNISGRIGFIAASGENSYYIDEKSDIKLLLNNDNKKIAEMEAYNDFGDIIKVQYTLEKQDNGYWKITQEEGYYSN